MSAKLASTAIRSEEDVVASAPPGSRDRLAASVSTPTIRPAWPRRFRKLRATRIHYAGGGQAEFFFDPISRRYEARISDEGPGSPT